MGAARALEVRDVDFKLGHILVRHAISGDEVMPPKSGHERVVPLAPELRVLLEAAVQLKFPHGRIVVNEHWTDAASSTRPRRLQTARGEVGRA
jgi:hypothetical protein